MHCTRIPRIGQRHPHAVLPLLLVLAQCTPPPASPARTDSATAAPASSTSDTETTDFWPLVSKTHGASAETQLTALREELARLPSDQVADFNRWFQDRFAQAYTWRVWGAAYLINGGCSEDCFAYFLAWLIAQGQPLFSSTVQDPDSLADLQGLIDIEEFADLLHLPSDVYLDKTGKELPPSAYARDVEMGPVWDFDDPTEMKKRYPKLWVKYVTAVAPGAPDRTTVLEPHLENSLDPTQPLDRYFSSTADLRRDY